MSRFTPARHVGNIRNGWHLVKNRKTLWQMLREALGGRYHMSWLTTAIILVAIIYILFPFDLLPDYIPFIGWIDDGVVIYLLLKRLSKETQRFNRFKAIGRKG
jgi:uncharacterized membrane protein YkvA (DUF1232 family)